jgi:hypothetical protein
VASGDIALQVTGTGLFRDDSERPSGSNVTTQTAEFRNGTTASAANGGSFVSAVLVVSKTTSGSVSVEMAFDSSKNYTITVTET